MTNKNLFKRIVLIVLGILSFQLIFSQENYISGYVIKNNSDTVHGLIDYRNWSYNPNTINFKKNMKDDPVSFSPNDIKEFKVGKEIYVSGTIKSEISSSQTNQLSYEFSIKTKDHKTFVKTLIRGNKSLYYFKNIDEKENFYIKQDTSFELLIYKKFLTTKNSKDLITENKRFIGQLAIYLADCKTIQTQLKNTTYSEKSLMRLFEYYYKCSPDDMNFKKEIEKIKIKFGVFTGISRTTLIFKGDAISDYLAAGYEPSINLCYGLSVDLNMPKDARKWSIKNEIIYSSFLVKGNYLDYQNENQYSTTKTEIGYTFLKMNNLVRYKYPVGPFLLFFNAGLANGFVINETNYKIKETKFYTTNHLDEGEAIPFTRNHELSYILGTGLYFKRFSLEYRFEKGNGISNTTKISSKTNRNYLLLGFRF